MSTGLTLEESQRYDRQVRIWGAEAQKRLQTSKVLISGLRGLNVEVAKNLDNTNVVIEDLGHNFFINEHDVGKYLASAMVANVQELNSFATVIFNTQSIAESSDNFFLNYDIILYGGWSEAEALRINRLCRSKDPKTGFFWSGAFGNESWFISDFGSSFTYKPDQPNDKDIKTGSSFSLQEVLDKKWSELINRKRFPLSKTYAKSRILAKFRDIQHRYEVSESDIGAITAVASHMLLHNGLDVSALESTDPNPASLTKDDLQRLCQKATSITIISCSVLGSFLAQEVVKSISRSGCPYSCIFLFDGESFDVRSYAIDMMLA